MRPISSASHIGVGEEIQPGLAEARKMSSVEALDVLDRVQDKSLVGEDMPLRVTVCLTVDKPAERLHLGFKHCGSAVAQMSRQQATHHHIAVFPIVVADAVCLGQHEIAIIVILCDRDVDLVPAEIRDPIDRAI
ncbi:MAG: hypothetical protein WA417_11135 [Stellaceae bacterium]